MDCVTKPVHTSEALTAGGLRALEVGLSLLILGYVFRSVLTFAAWMLEFLWS